MSIRRRRLYALSLVLGISQIGPVLVFVTLFILEPELRVFIACAVLVLLAFLAWMIVVVTRGNRIGEATRRAAAPESVVFGAYNHPGALVHAGDYVVPGAEIARGLGFIVVVDDAGIGYLTPGRSPQPFVEAAGAGNRGADHRAPAAAAVVIFLCHLRVA